VSLEKTNSETPPKHQVDKPTRHSPEILNKPKR